mmetsp:Transcript_20806/g.35471  ORF Transcript_20806/g.35471 Transcript_20806/m.35471 type:complete len:113 (-) Transcript_20806:619-957(-)
MMKEEDDEATKPPASSPSSSPSLWVGPFGITPAHVLLISSVPFCAGVHVGYQRLVREATKGLAEPKKLHPNLRNLGLRALGIASMLSVGSFTIMGAGEQQQQDWWAPIFDPF